MIENEGNHRKRRDPGTESKKKEIKRLRYSGMEYENRNKNKVSAKEPPSFEVSFVYSIFF